MSGAVYPEVEYRRRMAQIHGSWVVEKRLCDRCGGNHAGEGPDKAEALFDFLLQRDGPMCKVNQAMNERRLLP